MVPGLKSIRPLVDGAFCILKSVLSKLQVDKKLNDLNMVNKQGVIILAKETEMSTKYQPNEVEKGKYEEWLELIYLKQVKMSKQNLIPL